MKKPIDVPDAEVLSVGSTGPQVVELQKSLNIARYYCGAEDGHYSTRTRDAVLALQADMGLALTGTADEATLAALLTAPPRQVAEERQSRGLMSMIGRSRVVSSSMVNAVLGTLFTGGGGISLLSDFADKASDAKSYFGQVQNAVSGVPTWFVIAMVIMGIGIVWQSLRAAYARLEDHTTGKTL
jgi:hypothetical protein